jgi:hypothetical protein
MGLCPRSSRTMRGVIFSAENEVGERPPGVALPQTPGFSEAWQRTPNGRSIHVAEGMTMRSCDHSDDAACHPAEKRWHEHGV